MKWFILLISLACCQLKAQNVNLQIPENSIKVENDSLKFTIKATNNDSLTYVFYNLTYADFNHYAVDSLINTAFNTLLPRLLVDVFDRNNELPKIIRAEMGQIDFSKLPSINKYQLVKPKFTNEFKIAISLWNLNLKSGSYKLQLKYFSNSYYRKSYEKAKKKDVNLSNSVLFTGVVKSNICSFVYP